MAGRRGVEDMRDDAMPLCSAGTSVMCLFSTLMLGAIVCGEEVIPAESGTAADLHGANRTFASEGSAHWFG